MNFHKNLRSGRPECFYWIADGGGTPEIAFWTDGRWWLTGSDEPALEHLVVVLSGRLEVPSAAGAT